MLCLITYVNAEATADAEATAEAAPVRITAGSYRQPPLPGSPKEEMVQKPSNKVQVVSVQILENDDQRPPGFIEPLDSRERPEYKEITRKDREKGEVHQVRVSYVIIQSGEKSFAVFLCLIARVIKRSTYCTKLNRPRNCGFLA